MYAFTCLSLVSPAVYCTMLNYSYLSNSLIRDTVEPRKRGPLSCNVSPSAKLFLCVKLTNKRHCWAQEARPIIMRYIPFRGTVDRMEPHFFCLIFLADDYLVAVNGWRRVCSPLASFVCYSIRALPIQLCCFPCAKRIMPVLIGHLHAKQPCLGDSQNVQILPTFLYVPQPDCFEQWRQTSAFNSSIRNSNNPKYLHRSQAQIRHFCTRGRKSPSLQLYYRDLWMKSIRSQGLSLECMEENKKKVILTQKQDYLKWCVSRKRCAGNEEAPWTMTW